MLKEDIVIVGLGPGSPEHLSLGAWEVIKKAEKLLLRTVRHPVVEWLDSKGISYKSYDECYEKGSSFEEVYDLIAESVIKESLSGPVVYAVPGHPFMGEKTVEKILSKARERGILYKIVPSMGFVDIIYARIGPELGEKNELVDGLQMDEWQPRPGVGYIIYQVFDRFIASDVKLRLLEHYPPEYPVKVIRAAGVPQLEKIEKIPLYQLDRLHWIDHLTSVYIPPLGEDNISSSIKARFPLDPIVDVMARLRGENGCPWDREQDHHSLTPYLLEEAYEVLDALEQEDMHKFCEELGDLLLQIVFHAQIARENGHFTINDVVKSITEKMVRRHPHVFGDVSVENSSQVLENWEKIKQGEKDGDYRAKSILDDIPRGLPALLRASKVQKKVARVGFDWPDYQGPLEKIKEEQEELLRAYRAKDRRLIQQEVGDLLFAVVNLSRFFGVEAEVALNSTVEKFVRRFKFIEESVKKQGKKLDCCSLEELDALWERAKKIEN